MEELLQWLQRAVDQRVSDVYLLPRGEQYGLFFRLPQGVREQTRVGRHVASRWLNYLKYQAGMNVAEHRRVQLGALVLSQPEVTLRLSTVGDVNQQETLVARLIYGIPPLDDDSRQAVTTLLPLVKKRGLLALSGATGSGKTTLLYQLAEALSPELMVMTIEDPVEILHPRFLQLQVNPAAEMSYAALLKAALRHRPDVLIIGEIRDGQTAQAACEAAVSGHIVLATVHAKSAALVPLRLQALGVSTALVTAALVASAEVRLVFSPRIHAELDLAVFEGGKPDAT